MTAPVEQPKGGDRASPGAIEQKLTAICESVLERRRVGLHDNLFELGASSLKLIEIHEQIDQEFPGEVDLTELFDFPTIAALADPLRGKLTAQPEGPGRCARGRAVCPHAPAGRVELTDCQGGAPLDRPGPTDFGGHSRLGKSVRPRQY